MKKRRQKNTEAMRGRRVQKRAEEKKKSWNKAVRAWSEAEERLCGRVSYFASLAASAGGLCVSVCVCGFKKGCAESDSQSLKGEDIREIKVR